MKYITIILLLLLFGASQSFSQGDELQSSFGGRSDSYKKVPQELKVKTSKFFNFLLDSNVNAAYKELMMNSFLVAQNDKMKALENQTHKAFEIYGLLKGFEPVNAEEITKSFIRIRYIGLHTKFPMRWIFTFYKSPSAGWIVTNVKFDDLTEYYFTDQ
jgi:hypothetical protein